MAATRMKIYMPDISPQVGGGWTFSRNIKKALAGKAEFVSRWQDCDVFFAFSVTTTDGDEVKTAKEAGKPFVFRVDNVPRMSRNKGKKPHEKMRLFAEMADVVVYQSEWAARYCEPLCGKGTVIYNGVDMKLFSPANVPPLVPTYLFAFHGKNDHKAFWEAHYIFQVEHRWNHEAVFIFIYDFRSQYGELVNANFDFWNDEEYHHLPPVQDEERMADIMKKCTHLIYPAIQDACPNLVLEARASELEIIGVRDKYYGGTAELLDPSLDISLERMGVEYLGVMELALHG